MASLIRNVRVLQGHTLTHKRTHLMNEIPLDCLVMFQSDCSCKEYAIKQEEEYLDGNPSLLLLLFRSCKEEKRQSENQTVFRIA